MTFFKQKYKVFIQNNQFKNVVYKLAAPAQVLTQILFVFAGHGYIHIPISPHAWWRHDIEMILN